MQRKQGRGAPAAHGHCAAGAGAARRAPAGRSPDPACCRPPRPPNRAAADPEAREALAVCNPRAAALRARYDTWDYVVPAAASSAGGGAGGSMSGPTCGAAGMPTAPAAVRATAAPGAAAIVLRHGGRSVARRLPRGAAVGSIKLLAERLFGIKAARQALLLWEGGAGGEGRADGGVDGGGGSRGLDIGGDDTKPLSYWTPQVGGCVTLGICA